MQKKCSCMLFKACAPSNADTLGWSCSSTLRDESLSRSKSVWLIPLSPATSLLFWSMHSFLLPLPATFQHLHASAHTNSVYMYAFIRIYYPSLYSVLFQFSPFLSLVSIIKPLFIRLIPLTSAQNVRDFFSLANFGCAYLPVCHRLIENPALPISISQVELSGGRLWTRAITSLRAAEESGGCHRTEALLAV